ncbi:HTH domain-containing protein [Aquimarina sp. U1-2]|uniref:helix-turn-helix transcriptional regulator n=1 Tax=Aquimarina sp. U1-2 TaxID=2823141 RepID=UPI001AEC9EEB|nr:HTH domain-containing protein [Aquimarina sp. U1-2]MBP2831072.1 HTH domain-containing protein [Aquimarina sp. U1-2]
MTTDLVASTYLVLKEKDQKKLERLIAIIDRCHTPKKLTPTFLAEAFNVSKRTIYRDINTLQKANIPILINKEQGVYLANSLDVFVSDLSEEEIRALYISKLHIKCHSPEYYQDFDNAVKKLFENLPLSIQTSIRDIVHR